jgi:hypothetical protein
MFRLSAVFLFLLGFFLSLGHATAAEPPSAPLSVAVTLESFEALPDANGVRVVWVTISELNTLGFRVYRATTPNGTLTRLTGLIPTQAPNGGGARYEFVDTSAQVGNVYYYYLDAVGANGQTKRYGPAEIDLTPTAVTVSAFTTERNEGSWAWLSVVALAGLAGISIVRLRRR